jgi:hypothetical protein
VSTSFRVIALPAEPFAPLFGRSDAERLAIGARRAVADEKPGYPCRVSLADAEVGETVLLLPFTHHDVSSPYRASGPIVVRGGVTTATPAPGEIPPMLRHRLLSLRGYDAEAMLVAAEIANGSDLEVAIRRLFTSDRVSYLHVHDAVPGCTSCRVVRA